jgi:UDP:flavonoid glycosyltransferase YjiC (YdhE family)
LRILFSTTAGEGHFGPLVPFAIACRSAGHHVGVAAPASFEDSVRREGLEFMPFGERTDEDVASLFARIRTSSFEEGNRLMLGEGAVMYARAAVPRFIDIVDTWQPELIVRETWELASAVVGSDRGIPRAHIAVGILDLFDVLVDAAAAPLAALAADQGLAVPTGGALFSSETVLTLTPASLEPGDRPVRRYRDATNEVPPDPAFDGQEPLVYVTFGTEASGPGLFPGLFARTISALANSGWRVLVTVGRSADPSALDPLPASVRVERWIDQSTILPLARVVVCHGGYGTTLGALKAGVPVVAVPLFSAGQHENARRVASAGAGISIGGPERLGELRTMVTRVLEEPNFKLGAQRIADEIRALPPVDDAVSLLQDLARPGRGNAMPATS